MDTITESYFNSLLESALEEGKKLKAIAKGAKAAERHVIKHGVKTAVGAGLGALVAGKKGAAIGAGVGYLVSRKSERNKKLKALKKARAAKKEKHG